MLSEYVPLWVVALISPALTFIGGRVPATFKPIIAFGLSVLVIIFTVLISPLGWEALPAQAIILFGMVTTGYTAAKGIDTLAAKTAAKAVVTVALVGLAAQAYAQTGDSTAVPDVGTAVVQTADFWIQVGIVWLAGIASRSIKRLLT